MESTRPHYHTPEFRVTDTDSGVSSQQLSISFTAESIDLAAQPVGNGACWHDLLPNPRIIRGFPILRRNELDTGAEMSLNIMAGLMGSELVDMFNGKLFIKGFSAMLIPTRTDGKFIYWHMIQKSDGSRISYLDSNIGHIENLTYADLDKSRHVVGWCSEANFYAGMISQHARPWKWILTIAQ
jgi:hypothetical protein